MKYRPEIDGLRAVSVTAVILFHAGINGFAGGFIGVDVFFVISGFLITQILIGEMTAGNFSIARFYERRARRILPALYTVMAVSSVVALYLLLPNPLIDFARGMMATLLFVSNIWFWWRGADYFSPDAERDPLLHTWSLGVEEQYYLVFPLLVLVLWRLGRPRVAMVLAGLSVLSLGVAEIGWRVIPEANFYLLSSRAWQLGIGSLGAFAWLRPGGMRIPALAREIGAATGLALVVGCIALMDSGTPFPSLYAVPPTLGALMILLFATRETVTGRLLALRPLVVIGLMSYSAYLWHQPLLAFARIAAPDTLTLSQKLGLCALTFALAWPTLIFVERPFRDRSFLRQGQVFLASAAGGAVLLAAAGIVQISGGFRDYYPEHLRAAASLSNAEQGSYVRGAYNAHGPGGFTEGGGPKLLLIGDSFSQDLYNMIRETGAFPGYQIALSYVLARCQIYLGPEDITPLIEPPDRRMCGWHPLDPTAVDLAAQADVVIFALSWRDWSAERLPTTIENFHFRPDQTVLVLGRKRFGMINRPLIVGRSREDLVALRLDPGANHAAIVAQMRRELSPDLLIDSQSLICGGETCPLFTPEGALISVDGAHLTKEGAAYVGSLIFADPKLARFAGPKPGG